MRRRSREITFFQGLLLLELALSRSGIDSSLAVFGHV